MKEIKALTSLRGIFAMWVVLFHLRAWSDLADTPVLLVDRGYLGVDFFFMLSGFILATRHGAEFASGYRLSTHVGFLIKRFGRMFPLHWAVLAVVVVSMRLTGKPSYWWTHIASEAALIHRWDLIYVPRAALNGPDWSISTEWAANILFPAFVAASGFGSRRGFRAIALAATYIVALVSLGVANGDMNIAEANSPLPIVRCFAEFGIGMLLFRWRDLFRPLANDLVLCALFFAIGIALAIRVDLLVIALMIPLLAGLALNMGRVSTALSARWLHFGGVISYSVYLVQLPIILATDALLAGSRMSSLGHWMVPPVAIMAAAALTYKSIEKPANQLLKSASAGISAYKVQAL
jgi:peptidoglycan/LPS O-acetylase OafA/YrhL